MTKVQFLRPFLFNSGGTIVYMVCLWIINIFVVRLSTGFSDAGNLALAMSIANIFRTVALFGVRNFQVSDINNEFSNNIYVTSRIITVIVSFISCFLYTLMFINTWYQRVIILSFMLFVEGESFIDVLNGIEQKNGKLEYVGVSLAIRGFILLFMFLIIFPKFGLIISLLCIAFSTTIISLIYDLFSLNKITTFKLQLNIKKIILLHKKCLPIALQNILYVCLVSIPRNSLEFLKGTKALGAYNSATIPAIATQLIALFIFTPLINSFSELSLRGHYNKFIKLFFIIFLFILLTCLILITIVRLFGDIGLNILFGQNINNYSYLLNDAMINASLTAIDWYLIMILTVLRKLKCIMLSHLIGFLICIFTVNWFISSYDLNGTNLVQILSLSIVNLIQIIICFKFIFLISKHNKVII
ncbi:MAG: hypothetical protein LBS60_08585 [Deltaproteobacteria bacterium]|jgi:O-antigen/teichoic acid export membrane protein|nr:hypothetical protein [Deltaproteobacteria bacterium]